MSPTNRFATIAIAISLVIGGCSSTKDESVAAATTASTEPATLETETSAGDSTETSSPEATDTTDTTTATTITTKSNTAAAKGYLKREIYHHGSRQQIHRVREHAEENE